MGFAGQVFAARVAIGLAVPSPQAMQQSAGIIFQGVEAMYNRLAMLKKRNAMESEGALAEQFQGLSKLTVSSAKLMNDTLAQGVVDSIKKMDSATGQSLSSSLSRMGKQTKAFHSTQQALGKDSKLGKVFDTEGVEGDANKLAQITKRYMSLLREERDLVIQTTQDQLNGSRLLLQSYEAEIISMNSLKELNEEEQIRYDELNDKLIPALKEKVKFEELDVKILKQIEDNTKRVTREINAESEATRQLNQALRSSVHEIKEGFNNALRNSVALLTAFGYKLNQHAQDLITFERELLNANSVFGQTNSDLFDIGNDILEFGNKYGLAVENGAQGLYQLASAGLTANEAAALLPHTLKLSMAVQGDHNTLAKLTTQVIKGYGMEFSEAARLTDMFAYAIQKSLIEWQDLASAVKFAMPFFTSTGQSIEQLLGALQILTDRALEAGIAGRGLRQALAEFAESALDAEVASDSALISRVTRLVLSSICFKILTSSSSNLTFSFKAGINLSFNSSYLICSSSFNSFKLFIEIISASYDCNKSLLPLSWSCVVCITKSLSSLRRLMYRLVICANLLASPSTPSVSNTLPNLLSFPKACCVL